VEPQVVHRVHCGTGHGQFAQAELLKLQKIGQMKKKVAVKNFILPSKTLFSFFAAGPDT
jgi:hypothetical protein